MYEETKFVDLESYGFGPNIMKKTRICSKCGRATNTSGNHCPICGNQLQLYTLYDWYKRMHRSCSSCNTVLTSDTLYCPHCGVKIK